MALYGSIRENVDSKESWSQYVERIEHFFTAIEISSLKTVLAIFVEKQARVVRRSRKSPWRSITLSHSTTSSRLFRSPRSNTNSSHSYRRQISNSSTQNQSSFVKHVREEEGTKTRNEYPEYTLFNVPSRSQKSPLQVTVEVDHMPLTMEVDTGAAFSIISWRTYDQLFSSRCFRKTDEKLKTYLGEMLPMFGKFHADIEYNHQKQNLLLVVAGEVGPSLLGCNWLSYLRLNWNSLFHVVDHQPLSDLLTKYSMVFSNNLGTLKGYKAKLCLDNTKPIFRKARPVPTLFVYKLKLNLMISSNVKSLN